MQPWMHPFVLENASLLIGSGMYCLSSSLTDVLFWHPAVPFVACCGMLIFVAMLQLASDLKHLRNVEM